MRRTFSSSTGAKGWLRTGLFGVMAAAALGTAPVKAQGFDSTPPADFDAGSETLKPGQFLWTPDASPTGAMTIYVDLSRQMAAVYRGGVRIGLSTISSGREGFETPTGVFKITAKDANHHSNRYDNAPMPFTERLTDDGVSLHAGRVPGYPESHGCVHLPYSFAKALFRETRIGVTVVMEGGAFDGDRATVTPGSTGAAEIAATTAPASAADTGITLVSSRRQADVRP